MAYNNYTPQFYPPQYMAPQMQANVNQQNNSGITWVQGENAAKSFPVGAGQSVLLMDSENPVMYIKSTDQSGMPLPLRIFDYTERVSKPKEDEKVNSSVNTDYVTKHEFDSFKEEIKSEFKKYRYNKVPSKEVEKGTN